MPSPGHLQGQSRYQFTVTHASLPCTTEYISTPCHLRARPTSVTTGNPLPAVSMTHPPLLGTSYDFYKARLHYNWVSTPSHLSGPPLPLLGIQPSYLRGPSPPLLGIHFQPFPWPPSATAGYSPLAIYVACLRSATTGYPSPAIYVAHLWSATTGYLLPAYVLHGITPIAHFTTTRRPTCCVHINKAYPSLLWEAPAAAFGSL